MWMVGVVGRLIDLKAHPYYAYDESGQTLCQILWTMADRNNLDSIMFTNPCI